MSNNLGSEFFKAGGSDIIRRVTNLEDWACRTSSRPRQTGSSGGTQNSGIGDSLDTIPEDQVIFDPVDGHNHDGATSHVIPLVGDVTGNNEAAVVVQIEGKAIAAPGAPEDKKVPYYNNAGNNFLYSPFTTTTFIGAWRTADCSLLAAADAAQINAFADVAHPSSVPLACTVANLVIRLSGDVGGAGQNLVATVYKNGVATALTATVAGGAGVEVRAIATVPVAFAAGDDIEVQAKFAVGAPAAVLATYTVWGYFTP